MLNKLIPDKNTNELYHSFCSECKEETIFRWLECDYHDECNLLICTKCGAEHEEEIKNEPCVYKL